MNKKVIFYILIMVIQASFPLYGQSLNQFIEMARDNSAQVKALDTEYAAAKLVSQQVASFPDPEISLGLGILPVETRLGPQQIRLGVSQMIPWPGLLDSKRELADAMAQVKSVDSENYLIEVEFQVKKAYYKLYGLRKKSASIEEQINLLTILKDIATVRIESGEARLSDILQIESKIIELKGKKSALRQAEETPTIIINRYAFRNTSEQIAITDSFELSKGALYSEEMVTALHPKLRKLDKMKVVSEKSISLTNYQAKPKIGVGLDYIMVGQRDDLSPEGNGRDILMPMGRISIPLNKRQYSSKKEEEKLKMMAFDNYKQELSQIFMLEINTAQNTIEEAQINYRWNGDVIENNLATIDLIQTAYTSSSARIDELLVLYSDNIKYELARIDAVISSLIAKASIEKYRQKS